MNLVSRIFSRRMFLFFSRLPAPDLSVFYQEISTETDKNIQIEDRQLIVHSYIIVEMFTFAMIGEDE